MKHHGLLIVLVCVLQLLAGCSTPPDGPGALHHDGMERAYHLHAGEDLPESAPLVVVMHGYGGNGAWVREHLGWVELADQEGFAVCFPEGTLDEQGNQFWNVGYERHLDSEIDDNAFIVTLVRHLQERHDLDPDRTFATGFSNGGDMSIQLAAVAPESFRAIGPVVGTMMEPLYASCSPDIPRPMIAFNGTDDQVTRFAGDLANDDGWGPYESTPNIIALWRDLNDTELVTTTTLPDLDPEDGSIVELERHHSNRHGREVRLYRVVGGGHDWPGVSGNMDVDATGEIWRFFESTCSPE
jgi:polyhydroxybutyrate depolymerase